MAEAGGKCANPGCPVALIELHHIREWAVYQTHDHQHMIALCPACHEQVHRGGLRIADSDLYLWKQQRRLPDEQKHTGLYVEPSTDRKFYLGFVSLEVTGQKSVLQISTGNSVTIEFRDDDLLIVDVTLTAHGGTRVVRLTNGTLSTKEVKDVTLRTRTGLVELWAPATSSIIPRWVINRLRTIPNQPYGDRMLLFRVMVLAPGRVLVEGVWAQHDRAIIAYADAIHWVSRTHSEPITALPDLMGAVSYKADKLLHPVFGFPDEPAEWVWKHFDPSKGPIAIDPNED